MPTSTNRRELPVVRWLRLGAAAAGVGIALAAAPAAVAWADDSPASSRDGAGRGDSDGVRGSAVAHTNAGSAAPGASTFTAPRSSRPGPARAAAAVTARQRDAVELPDVPAPVAPASAVTSSAVTGSAPATSTLAVPSASATPSPVAATPAQPTGAAPAAPAPVNSAPGPGSFSATLRLNLEDVFTGTGKPTVTNPTAVVTGLFNEVLRRDPTAAELENYLNRLKFTGVNGVVAGLYTSQAFRQNSVNNYYLELLGRTPTQRELTSGALRLALGSEPGFAASLAGSQEFYGESASGGGKFGTQPSATTYVDLLYRALLGEATGASAAPLVQQIQGGLPIQWAANRFVNTDAYRTVKVGEVYQVLGQEPTPTDIAGYVKNWFLAGGQGGISRSLLATSANVQRLEAGLVPFPDTEAAADLQKLLLSYYTDSPDGFTKLFNSLLSLDPNNPISKDNPCTSSNPSCNYALFDLVTTGGPDRGIPNNALELTSITADVTTLIPTQNEIDLRSSLRFPLQDPALLTAYFAGGVIQPFGNPVVTADRGTYIVDGHHRWSQIYLINPFTQVTALDLGYVPTPQTALKEAQMGVMAGKGYLASATVQGENLYTIDEAAFDTAVTKFIADGAQEAAVRAVFGRYLGFDPNATPLEDQFTIIQNYLWGNVLRMRDLNPYIPDAPSRSVMPQTDPLPVTQGYWASGDLSYSFPTISYLG